MVVGQVVCVVGVSRGCGGGGGGGGGGMFLGGEVVEGRLWYRERGKKIGSTESR